MCRSILPCWLTDRVVLDEAYELIRLVESLLLSLLTSVSCFCLTSVLKVLKELPECDSTDYVTVGSGNIGKGRWTEEDEDAEQSGANLMDEDESEDGGSKVCVYVRGTVLCKSSIPMAVVPTFLCVLALAYCSWFGIRSSVITVVLRVRCSTKCTVVFVFQRLPLGRWNIPNLLSHVARLLHTLLTIDVPIFTICISRGVSSLVHL